MKTSILLLLGILTAGNIAFGDCKVSPEESLRFIQSKDSSKKEVRDISTIKEIGFYQNQISDGDLKYLCQAKNLTSLKIVNDGWEENGLTGNTFEELSGLSELKYLDLDSNNITAKNLIKLAPLKKLTGLRLYNNPLGDTGFEGLLQLPALKSVSLQGGKSADRRLSLNALKSISFLAIHPSLEALTLTYNDLTNSALEYLKGFKNLKKLILTVRGAGSSVGSSAVQNSFHGGPEWQQLLGLSLLEEMEVSVKNADTYFDEFLSSLKNIRKLDLRGYGLNSSELSFLVNLKQLKFLNISENKVEVSLLTGLASMSSLKNLVLVDYKFQASDLAALASSKSLECLDMTRSGLTAPALVEFVKGTQLKWFVEDSRFEDEIISLDSDVYNKFSDQCFYEP